MGFFADIASEARRGVVQAPPPVRQTVAAPPPAAPETAAAQPVPQPEPLPTPATAKPEPTPAPEQPEPEQPAAPAIDLTPAANAADDAERRKAHEAAEAKRKAEFDARQAEKAAARQKQIDRIAAMSAADLLAEATGRVATDTERLTRRNMKEAVSEHIQAKCREDAAFAQRTMLPEKSMVNCFKYIFRLGQKLAEQEIEDNGVGRVDVYGMDIPDGQVYQWAEDYFNSDDIEEDHKDDEKFIPKPYIPAPSKSSKSKAAKKSSGSAKSKAGKSSESCIEQISLM